MRARRGMVAALLIAAAFGGCTEVSTDPQVPLSLQFDSLPALAVVVGDTLRGGDLEPARIPVRAFNSAEGLVADTQIRVIGIDTTSVKAFTLLSGLRLLGKVENAAVRVVAQAGSLQSQTQTFAVVPLPTGIGNTAIDSVVYDAPDTSTRYHGVHVTVFRQASPDSAKVFLNGLRVRLRVVSVTDSVLDSARLVDSTTGRNATSALISSSIASLRLKVYPKASVNALADGIVTIEASHKAFGTDIPGSPFRFTVRLVPFKL
jgi:hypothetical protein